MTVTRALYSVTSYRAGGNDINVSMKVLIAMAAALGADPIGAIARFHTKQQRMAGVIR